MQQTLYSDIRDMLRAIFCAQRNAFKISLSFGFIVSNIETGEKRYYYPSAKWVGFQPAAGGGRRGGSTESAAVRGADGLAQVRQTTEAQHQVAHRLAHQRALSPVPFGGQTYRAWQDHGPVAQVAGRESRSGCTGKRQKHWQGLC